ncbi:MAG TPA: primosomal protein N', partial [Actinotalea sp.]|nr:primosomal protein N' [Actinotalea sp.]
DQGGVVLLVGDGAPVPTQALVRWDPAGLAERELAERTELGLPPAVHLVAVDGPREAVEQLVAGLRERTTVLGPIPLEHATAQPPDEQGTLEPETTRPVRALLRTPWPDSPELLAELAAALAVRSARRQSPVRVQVEPLDVV